MTTPATPGISAPLRDHPQPVRVHARMAMDRDGLLTNLIGAMAEIGCGKVVFRA
jgi:hypothetical protein